VLRDGFYIAVIAYIKTKTAIIFEFMTMPASGALSVGLVGWVTEWVHLSWIRTIIDGMMALFFLVAVAKTGALEGRARTIR